MRITHRNALKGLPNTGEPKDNLPSVVSAQQTPKALFRNGFWYAGDVRCGSYREALKNTLLAAGVIAEKPKSLLQKRYPRPERLETRAWWEAFLDARAIREAKRIADEQAVKHAEAERIWAAVKAAGSVRKEEKGNRARLPFPEPPKATQPRTLRGRAVAALLTRGAGA